MKWFRFYSEFIDDPKIAMMSDSDQLLWVKALCLASESKERGKILLSDDEICWKIRCTKETWLHAIDKFRAKGMIEHCAGGYQISNWEKRQFSSDSSADSGYQKHRSFVYERDGYRCVYCGSTESLTLDHVIAQSKGGTHDPDNLVTACLSCNCSKNDKSLEEWGGR